MRAEFSEQSDWSVSLAFGRGSTEMIKEDLDHAHVTGTSDGEGLCPRPLLAIAGTAQS